MWGSKESIRKRPCLPGGEEASALTGVPWRVETQGEQAGRGGRREGFLEEVAGESGMRGINKKGEPGLEGVQVEKSFLAGKREGQALPTLQACDQTQVFPY